MDSDVRRPATPEEAKALAHPVRQRIIRLCGIRDRTNKDLADRLERDPATVLHHVRQLVATGFLEPCEERIGPSGAREKPYRSTGRSWSVDLAVDGAVRVEGGMLDATRAELAHAGPESIRYSSRVALRLPDDELQVLVNRIEELVEDAVRRSAPLDDPSLPAFGGLFVVHRFRDDEVDDDAVVDDEPPGGTASDA